MDADYQGGDVTERVRGVKSAEDCQKICAVTIGSFKGGYRASFWKLFLIVLDFLSFS